MGEGMTVDDLAAAMGTISYEVLANLGRRYHRIYKAHDLPRIARAPPPPGAPCSRHVV